MIRHGQRKLSTLFSTLALAQLGSMQVARAQDASSVVYEDARDLIQDVIVSEVAKSSANLMVCVSPQGVAKYFPNTIAAMRDNRIGELSVSTRREAAVFVASWVYSSTSAAGKFVKPWSMLPLQTASASELQTCTTEMEKAAWEPDPRLTPEYATCLTEVPKDADTLVACDAGAMAEAAVLGDVEALRIQVLRLTAGSFLAPLLGGGETAGVQERVQVLRRIVTSRVLHALGKGRSDDPWSVAVIDKPAIEGSEPLKADVAQLAAGGRAVATWIERLIAMDAALEQGRKILSGDISPVSVRLALQVGLDAVPANRKCATPPANAGCRRAANLEALVASGEFEALLSALKDKNAAQFGINALDLALKSAEDSSTDEEKKQQLKLMRPVVINLLRYSVAAPQERNQQLREATKQALFDYLSRNKGNGYMPHDDHSWSADVGSLSLGASFSTGYSGGAREGLRTPVSIEVGQLLVAIKKSPTLFTAIQGSALDALGPFSEIALRDAKASFGHASRVWWNVIHPRIDLLVGVPLFSKRLVLFAGIGARPAVAFGQGDGDYVYGSWFRSVRRSTTDTNSKWDYATRFFDTGAGVRFFPF